MTPPKVIYLQWYDAENGEELNALEEQVTWCEDCINDTDVAYVLASRIAELESDLDKSGVMINQQVKQNQELKAQLAAERDALLSSASDVVGMDVRIKELEAAYAEIVNAPYEAAQGRIAELEATMEFYANPDNYKENYDGLNAPYTNVVKDGGKRSRSVLEKKL